MLQQLVPLRPPCKEARRIWRLGFCDDLALARGDGRHPRLIKSIGRADLLILDDFGLEPLDAGARHDLLEIVEERYGRRSTIVTSQLPLSAWHEVVGDSTLS